MAKLRGNAVVAQSGGPTAVINASACGVIQACLRHRGVVGHVFGATNGILGVLREELFDLGREEPRSIALLRQSPAAAIGSCRYKLDPRDPRDYERILAVFQAHNVRYFFYAGGNDSMDTADKIHKLARAKGYELRVVGVPKTVDNDLACTDHSPGFGSVAKYLATSVMEAGRDTEALYTTDTCTILETMGRNAGWIAASTGLAARAPEDAPHLVYVPEIPFEPDRFVEDCKGVLARFGRLFIAASEGLKTPDGAYLASDKGAFGRDSFGHVQLGGVAEVLKHLVESRVGVKTRFNKPGTCQRAAMHCASKTDVDEAYLCGRDAVRHALQGVSGKMVTLLRKRSRPYACVTGLADLAEVANGVKGLPREFLNEAGNHITRKMRAYAEPLVRGEAPITIGPDGLPVFVRFKRKPVRKLCEDYAVR
ncbi:MAG: 6-phosphofructokinase [Planctomycetota bacterium]